MMQRILVLHQQQQSRSRRFPSRTAIVAAASSSLLLIFSQFQPAWGFSGATANPSGSLSLGLQNQPPHHHPLNSVPPGSSTSQSRLYSSNNPFSNFFGDMASSIASGKSSSVSINSKLDEKLSNFPGVPSWPDIRTTLQEMQTPEEQEFRTNLAKGYGVGSPLHALRLYEPTNKEEDVRVVFYRDSASWCPYCQKVWMALEEKRIPYRIEKVNMRCYGDKPASFLRMQPSGNIPVAKIDGRVYGQSNDILYALEEAFPEHKSLLPTDDQRERAQELLRLERRIFSAWLSWLTGSSRNKSEFVQVLKDVERELAKSQGPFFLGNSVSLVDFMYAPFLERLCASLLFYKGFLVRVPPGTPTDYPAFNQWMDGMETLPSYRLTKSDYYTHSWDLPPQLGGCTYEPDGERYQRAINGERTLDGTQGSWELPLQAHNGGAEPDWTWAVDGANREAVERVSYNHEAIVKFAARGAGRKGMPPFSAPLADPNAVPNDAVKVGVNTIFQIICIAMLQGAVGMATHEATLRQVAQTMLERGGETYVDGVVASLSYVRDRVGVPRDMKLPAARLLRSHLNWAIGHILSCQ